MPETIEINNREKMKKKKGPFVGQKNVIFNEQGGFCPQIVLSMLKINRDHELQSITETHYI